MIDITNYRTVDPAAARTCTRVKHCLYLKTLRCASYSYLFIFIKNILISKTLCHVLDSRTESNFTTMRNNGLKKLWHLSDITLKKNKSLWKSRSFRVKNNWLLAHIRSNLLDSKFYCIKWVSSCEQALIESV